MRSIRTYEEKQVEYDKPVLDAQAARRGYGPAGELLMGYNVDGLVEA